MIARLTGTLAAIEANSVILDVNGVGYRAFVPLSALGNLPGIGGQATLHTVMIVREDEITLYGFATVEERDLFQLLTSVTGVGPKVGLSFLSVMDAQALARAVSSNDIKALTRIPGVGPKLAQRVGLELGERMAQFLFDRRIDSAREEQFPESAGALEDVAEALVNLGYSRSDSRRAAERAAASAADKSDTPALIRDALNLLSRA